MAESVAPPAFGECETCFNQVTFPGWDRVCDECKAEQREEDEAARERLGEEDRYLYSVPLRSPIV